LLEDAGLRDESAVGVYKASSSEAAREAAEACAASGFIREVDNSNVIQGEPYVLIYSDSVDASSS
jgi:hypothetical protein